MRPAIAGMRWLLVVGVSSIVLSACTTAASSRASLVTAPSSPTTAASGAASASPTPDMRPLPLPTELKYKGTVEDPGKATLSLAAALKAGRAVTQDLIGADPVARLMLISDDTDKDNGGFGPTLAWVIVADDVKPILGTGLPTTSSSVPYNGTLSWTIIDMQGRVRSQWQNRYLGPNFPPALPRS